MAAKGEFFVTPHALARYLERVRPGMDEEAAREELLAFAARARVVRRTRDGRVLMRAPRPLRFRFVVGPGEGPLPAIVTVLSSYDGHVPRGSRNRGGEGER